MLITDSESVYHSIFPCQFILFRNSSPDNSPRASALYECIRVHSVWLRVSFPTALSAVIFRPVGLAAASVFSFCLCEYVICCMFQFRVYQFSGCVLSVCLSRAVV